MHNVLHLEGKQAFISIIYCYLGYMNLENIGVKLFQEYWNASETTSKIFRSNMLSASLKGLTQRTLIVPHPLGPEVG